VGELLGCHRSFDIVGFSLSPTSVGLLDDLISWVWEVLPPRGIDPPHVVGWMEGINLPPFNNKKEDYVSHFGYTFPDLGRDYGYMTSSANGVYSASQRFLHPDITREQFGEARYNRNLKLARQIMLPLKYMAHEVGDVFDCEFNPDSTPGKICKKFGYKTKGEVLAAHPDLLRWYWLFAHVYGVTPLWFASPKEEILLWEKIMSGVPRTFMYSDPFFITCYANLAHPYKDACLQLGSAYEWFPYRLGSTFVAGEYHKLMSTLDGRCTVQGDCTKWDSNYSSVLKDFSADLKNFVCDFDREDRERYSYYSHHCFHSYVRMPDGDVWRMLYKKSGDPTTTDDNCNGHFAIICDLIGDIAESMGEDPLTLYNEQRIHIYADDHVFGFQERLRKFLDYDSRSKVYARCGQKLHPPPADIVSHGPLGLTFLGGTCGQQYGRYVPTYKFERLLAPFLLFDYTEEELKEVLASLSPMLATNLKARDYVVEYVQLYHPRLLNLLDLNKDLFTGREKAGNGGRTDRNLFE